MERLGALGAITDLAGCVVVLALLVVLVWAAIERGGIHRTLALHRGLRIDAIVLLTAPSTSDAPKGD